MRALVLAGKIGPIFGTRGGLSTRYAHHEILSSLSIVNGPSYTQFVEVPLDASDFPYTIMRKRSAQLSFLFGAVEQDGAF